MHTVILQVNVAEFDIIKNNSVKLRKKQFQQLKRKNNLKENDMKCSVKIQIFYNYIKFV